MITQDPKLHISHVTQLQHTMTKSLFTKKNSDVDPWVGNIGLHPVKGYSRRVWDKCPTFVETIPKQVEQTIMNHSSHIHSPFAKPLKVMVETGKAHASRSGRGEALSIAGLGHER